MPLYEYRCTECSAVTDIRHGFDEINTAVCAKCNGALVRNFNVSGISFKGSGFYVNDSRPSASGDAKPASDSKSAA